MKKKKLSKKEIKDAKEIIDKMVKNLDEANELIKKLNKEADRNMNIKKVK